MGRIIYQWWANTKLGKRWEKHYIGAEFGLAVTAAVAAFVLSEFCGGKVCVSAVLNKVRPTLYPAFVSLFGSLFGFIIAAMTILVTWVGQTRFDHLRRRPGYRQLWPTFSSAIFWLAVASITSLVAMCVDKDDAAESCWVWYPLLGVLLVASFRLTRCVWVLSTLIHVIAPPLDPNTPGNDGPPTSK